MPDAGFSTDAPLHAFVGLGMVLGLEADADLARFRDELRLQAQLHEGFLAEFAPPKGAVVLDLDAGLGGFCLPLALKYPALRFHAVEPRDEFRTILGRNIQRLGLRNVVPLADIDLPAALDELAPVLLRLPPGDAALPGLLDAVTRSRADLLGTLPAGADPIAVARLCAGRRFALLPDGATVPMREAGQGEAPLLSIIVPTYGVGAYLVDCVKCLLPVSGETEWLEILVVLDGPPDPPTRAAAEMVSGWPGVQVLEKANGGCASARNYGFEASRGAYVAFVDADDYVDPGFFEALLRAALLGRAAMVQGSFDFAEQREDGIALRDSYEAKAAARWDRRSLGGLTVSSVPARLLVTGQPTIWRRIYDRAFLVEKRLHFPQHIRAFDDLYFNFLSVAHAQTVLHVHGPLYHYRQHPAQDVKQGDLRHLYEIDLLRRLAIEILAQGLPAMEDWWRVFFQTMKWSLNRIAPAHAAAFACGAALLLALIARATANAEPIARSRIALPMPAFQSALEAALERLPEGPGQAGLVHVDFPEFLPEFARAAEAVEALDAAHIPLPVARPAPAPAIRHGDDEAVEAALAMLNAPLAERSLPKRAAPRSRAEFLQGFALDYTTTPGTRPGVEQVALPQGGLGLAITGHEAFTALALEIRLPAALWLGREWLRVELAGEIEGKAEAVLWLQRELADGKKLREEVAAAAARAGRFSLLADLRPLAPRVVAASLLLPLAPGGGAKLLLRRARFA